jgi:hypothetical protein
VSAAREWDSPAELTLAELVALYLERHAATVRPRTITTLRERLAHALAAFGDVPLDGAGAGVAGRLDALDAARERAAAEG